MKTITDHPVIGMSYEIVIGGVAYGGQCRRLEVENDGGIVAVCQYFNDSNPDKTFRVLVDKNGKPV